MYTKKEIIEIYFSDQGKIDSFFIDQMVKRLSNDNLVKEFNRKSKGSRLVQFDKYRFRIEFFELTDDAILRLNTSEENMHYHDNKDMSRAEMRYRLLHNISL
jgi:hypothetical protein